VGLAVQRELKGQGEDAGRLATQAAAGGADALLALLQLAIRREREGRGEDPQRLWYQVNAAATALGFLAVRKDHERLLRQAAVTGNTQARLAQLAQLRELVRLAELRERAGKREDAERLAVQAAAAGNTQAVQRLVELRERAGSA
jgi:hypothetical protein